MLRSMGLEGWTAIWNPDPSQKARGKVLPDFKTILIFDENEDDALETLVHESVEIIMKPVFFQYRTMVNQLIEALEKIVYAEKERAIERLTPVILESRRGRLEAGREVLAPLQDEPSSV